MTIGVGVICIVVLLVLWRFCRCEHQWELVDKTELPSRLEEMQMHGKPQVMFSSEWVRCAQKKVLLVIRCPKCGAAKVLHGSN